MSLDKPFYQGEVVVCEDNRCLWLYTVASVWKNGVFTLAYYPNGEPVTHKTFRPDGWSRGESYHRLHVRHLAANETPEKLIKKQQDRDAKAAREREVSKAAFRAKVDAWWTATGKTLWDESVKVQVQGAELRLLAFPRDDVQDEQRVCLVQVCAQPRLLGEGEDTALHAGGVVLRGNPAGGVPYVNGFGSSSIHEDTLPEALYRLAH